MYKLIDHHDGGTWEKQVSEVVAGICDNYSHKLVTTSVANFADVVTQTPTQSSCDLADNSPNLTH